MFNPEINNDPSLETELPMQYGIAEYDPYIENVPIPSYANGGGIEGQEPIMEEELVDIEEMPQQIEGNEPSNPYPTLAEMIRQQGGEEDVILAHINPLEAKMLGVLANGGTTNPVTGLPQFGLFSNPKKWFKSNLGGGAGAILGNMILPGIGGIIGGALGGAAGSAIRGRHDLGSAALRGGAMGAILPTAAGLAGSGATSLGAKGMGSYLSNYGAQNAILPSIGLGGLGNVAGSTGANTPTVLSSSITNNGISPAVTSNAAAGQTGFMDSLIGNSKNYLSKPQNLLTLAMLGGSLANRPKPPKEKTPEELANEQKRFQQTLLLSEEERAKQEAALLAEEQMRRRVARQKFLPEERFSLEPMHVRTNTPEEYKQQGKWLNYYNNPEFSGNPLLMKTGGSTNPQIKYEVEEVDYPSGLGFYLNGETGGQDDDIHAMLSDGEYVIPADTVAHLGDGNNASGAKKLDDMVKKIRASKGLCSKLPAKAKSLTDYIGA